MRQLLSKLLGLIIVIASLSISLLPVHADTSAGACAITPDKLDGQGLNVSGLGLNVSGLGLNVSGLGLNVSGLGLNVSGLGLNVSGLSLEQIVQDIWTNPVTPAWLTQLLPGVEGGVGYNTVPAAILIVDDFSTPTSHGYDVRKVFDDLVAAVNAVRDPDPIITLVNVDINGANYDSMLIATKIRTTVNTLLPTHQHFAVNMSFGLVPCEDPVGTTITDSESGQTFTLNKPFDFDQMQAAAVSAPVVKTAPVRPILECVVYRGYGKYTAYFGYQNENTVSIKIPIGATNSFLPFPAGRGQPTTFMPGRQKFVFKVDFWGLPLAWNLYGPDKKVRTTIATSHWKQFCKDTPSLRPIQAGLNGYGGLTQFAMTKLGVPENFVDDYLEYLQNKGATVDNPLSGLRSLLREYLNRSAQEAADTNPNTRFALIPVASAGNFRPILGATPLSPAKYPEVIAVSATLGTFGNLWVMSHDGNVRAPGAGYILAKDASGGVTRVGAGTSFAAPYVTTLAALWLTYPNACQFAGGRVPLTNDPAAKNVNAIATIAGSGISPLACSKNTAPVVTLTSPITTSEGATISIGTVSDINSDPINVTSSLSGSTVVNVSGTLMFTHNDGPLVNQAVTITANDGRGGITSATFTLNVNNVAPTAQLNANSLTINAGQSVTLSLISPVDPGPVDTAAGFDYGFDCGTSSEGTVTSTGHINTLVCSYPNAGTFTARGLIRDKDGGIGQSTLTITVNPIVSPSACYATSVVSYVQGKRKDNYPIDSGRINATRALAAPQRNDSDNFVSLGFGDGVSTGLLVLDFYPKTIQNNAGLDLRVWETSFNDGSQPWSKHPEAVKVFASQDGITWVQIGTTTDKDQAYDLGTLSSARYIKLVDVSNRSKFSNSDDGFDVDGVEAYGCLPIPAETAPTEPAPIATEEIPVATEATPIPTEVTPVATEAASIPTEVTPVVTEVTPVPTEVTPIVTEVTPIATEPVATEVTPVPTAEVSGS